jgi:hypothetical protein
MPVKELVRTRSYDRLGVKGFASGNWRIRYTEASGLDDTYVESEKEYDEVSVNSDPRTIIEDSEWIRYGNSGFKSYNDCHHLRSHKSWGSSFDVNFNGHLTTHYDEEAPPYRLDSVRNVSGHLEIQLPGWLRSNAFGEESVETDPYLDPASELFKEKVQQLDEIALDTMIPVLDNWSLPVFLGELFEIRQLINYIRQTWSNMMKIKSVRRHFNKRTWKHDVRDGKRYLRTRSLRELSQHWLAAVFGWLPFQRDVRILIQKLITVVPKVNKFLEDEGKRRTFHFRKYLSPETFKDLEWFNTDTKEFSLNGSFGTPSCKFVMKCDKVTEMDRVTFTSTCEYSYHLPKFGPMIKRLLAEMDHFGLNVSISDVWELIPFSFLVDWFFKVGQRLEEYDFVNLPVQVVITNYCRSIKYRLTRSLKFKEFTSLSLINIPFLADSQCEWTVSPSSETIATHAVDSYWRSAEKPTPSQRQLPYFSFPSGKQWVTGFALYKTWR